MSRLTPINFWMSGFCSDLVIVATATWLSNTHDVSEIFAINVACHSTWMFRVVASLITERGSLYAAVASLLWFLLANVEASWILLIPAAACSAFHLTSVEADQIRLDVDVGLCLRCHAVGRACGAALGGFILYMTHDPSKVFALEVGFLVLTSLLKLLAERTPSSRSLVEPVLRVDSAEIYETAWRTAITCFTCYCVPHYGTVAYFYLAGPLRYGSIELTATEAAAAIGDYFGTTGEVGRPELAVLMWCISCALAASSLIALMLRFDALLGLPSEIFVFTSVFVVSLFRSRATRAHAEIAALVSDGRGRTYTMISSAPKMGKAMGMTVGLFLVRHFDIDHNDYEGAISLVEIPLVCSVVASLVATVALVHSLL